MQCRDLFQAEDSPMRTCFRMVSPDPYYSMCMNDVAQQKDVCQASAAYVRECRKVEVHVRMPPSCVKCEVPSHPTLNYAQSSAQLTLSEDKVPMTADVVLLLQHAPCNGALLNKLRAAVDDLDNALKAEGLQNNHFAVVGFGGRGYLEQPSIRTMDGQTFNTANKVVTAFNRFDLESGDTSDVLSALKFATTLPFRSGASKTVVLMACDACSEKTLRYSDLQRSLLNNDITLHVLTQETIQLKSRSPKTAYIFGVDDETVYTSRDVAGNDLEGDSSLRRYIRLPKDLCVALAQDSEGSIFSVRQWVDSRSYSLQKKFSDVWVRTVASKAQPSECQMCECVAETGYLGGQSQCHSCEPRNPVYSLMPNFYAPDFTDDSMSSRTPTAGDTNNQQQGSEEPRRSRDRGGDRASRRRRPRVRNDQTGSVPSRPEVRDQ
jgi:hypothetical protein